MRCIIHSVHGETDQGRGFGRIGRQDIDVLI